MTATPSTSHPGSAKVKVLLILLILLMLVLGWWRCYSSLVDARRCYVGYAVRVGLPPPELMLLCDMLALLALLGLGLLVVLGFATHRATSAQRAMLVLLVVSLVLSLDNLHDMLVHSCQRWTMERLASPALQRREYERRYNTATLLVMMEVAVLVLLLLARQMGLPLWMPAVMGAWLLVLLLIICSQ